MALSQTLTNNGGETGGGTTTTALAIGTAASDRMVAIIITADNILSSATIGGVAATLSQNNSVGVNLASLTASIPTGTTAVATFSGAGTWTIQGVWSVTGDAALAPTDRDDQVGSLTPQIDVTAGGCVIGFAADVSGAGGAPTFTAGLTTQGSPYFITTLPARAGAANFASAQTVNVTVSGPTTPLTSMFAFGVAAAGAGHPAMQRWGGVPGMTPGGNKFGRSW